MIAQHVSAHHMTSHCITWHDTTQAITPHQITWAHITSTNIASKQVTSPPWNSRRLVHSKDMVWASRWSVALRTFYRQILSLLYSSFFFWNFRPRLARELLVYNMIAYFWFIPFFPIFPTKHPGMNVFVIHLWQLDGSRIHRLELFYCLSFRFFSHVTGSKTPILVCFFSWGETKPPKVAGKVFLWEVGGWWNIVRGLFDHPDIVYIDI